MKRHLTLTQLEHHDWGPPPYDSFLVKECHRLRHVPLRDLTVENLRMLVGQGISLVYTVPLALEQLAISRGDDAASYQLLTRRTLHALHAEQQRAKRLQQAHDRLVDEYRTLREQTMRAALSTAA